jgi:hypothetical protein
MVPCTVIHINDIGYVKLFFHTGTLVVMIHVFDRVVTLRFLLRNLHSIYVWCDELYYTNLVHIHM